MKRYIPPYGSPGRDLMPLLGFAMLTVGALDQWTTSGVISPEVDERPGGHLIQHSAGDQVMLIVVVGAIVADALS